MIVIALYRVCGTGEDQADSPRQILPKDGHDVTGGRIFILCEKHLNVQSRHGAGELVLV